MRKYHNASIFTLRFFNMSLLTACMLMAVAMQPANASGRQSSEIDHLAGITGGEYANYMLSKEEILEREPQLESNGLLGGGVYLDYRNNDARLVIENIKRSVDDGAIAVSRLKVEEIIHDDKGKVSGVKAKDLLNNQTITINSKLVINTAGPWSDFVNKLDKKIDRSQSAYIS